MSFRMQNSSSFPGVMVPTSLILLPHFPALAVLLHLNVQARAKRESRLGCCRELGIIFMCRVNFVYVQNRVPV